MREQKLPPRATPPCHPPLTTLTHPQHNKNNNSVPATLTTRATFLAKADGVLAGQAVADRVFALVDPRVSLSWRKRDGDRLSSGETFAEAQGPARSLLLAERVALNFMQRMSGVATATASMVAEVDRGSRVAALTAAGGPTPSHRCRVLETRKTAPGLRLFDKWAVLIGGGSNHRMGLFDMVMVKDNHVAAAGGVAKAVAAVAAFLRGDEGQEAARRLGAARGGGGGEPAASIIPVEVEVRTLDEVDELVAVLRAGRGGEGGGGEVVTRVMLDNMVRRLPAAEAEAARKGASAAAAASKDTPEALERASGVDCSVLREAVRRLAEFSSGGGAGAGAGGAGAAGGAAGGGRPLETEASGNVTEATAAAVAASGVGFVSVGALTHSVVALDISFNIET
jgi:nicotinate-nucleotide pyrophosphorylase (carboxylating)